MVFQVGISPLRTKGSGKLKRSDCSWDNKKKGGKIVILRGGVPEEADCDRERRHRGRGGSINPYLRGTVKKKRGRNHVVVALACILSVGRLGEVKNWYLGQKKDKPTRKGNESSYRRGRKKREK